MTVVYPNASAGSEVTAYNTHVDCICNDHVHNWNDVAEEIVWVVCSMLEKWRLT